jgi:hypothetical protein
MEAICSSETFKFHRTTERYIPEEIILQILNMSVIEGFEVFTAVVMKSITFWDMTHGLHGVISQVVILFMSVIIRFENYYEPICFPNFFRSRHKTIIFALGLYGGATWCFPTREEHKLEIFQYTLLSNIFVPKKDEVSPTLDVT